MTQIYQEIVSAKEQNRKLLAILLDPEKVMLSDIKELCFKITESPATHIFVGGSTFNGNHLDDIIQVIKNHSNLPIVLFPGDYKQISAFADGILFLSLLSGRNSDYLAEHQVNAVPLLKKTSLEVIPTTYLLIESGIVTAVERVSATKPMNRNEYKYVAQTAKAGEYMGNKLVYLEAGSGAKNPVPLKMVSEVSNAIQVPLIVGGGIRTKEAIKKTFEAGADMIVVGTVFEINNSFFV
ncbi:geranylgeranylglyceryl/heptaprenylglyceryl phosphate synthase [Flavobacterium jejuense]|uniref:Geranylgeranylglyceryl phosphate synthase n=1 Tax=Flavobacterium jejuense TaxID=1544455 RepID=A0ABX0IXZ8_9FLAO|nr:geranylgeranylglyceryl/heptaprenylglyceryl phosphate synthase [Flavobacterium jejuense]NHN26625.1 geranylgeranylglyceryl/heptaprenylglyceryl phosphate synthase [Flavobacterium jejuense]